LFEKLFAKKGEEKVMHNLLINQMILSFTFLHALLAQNSFHRRGQISFRLELRDGTVY
jgi:hypothetical protein